MDIGRSFSYILEDEDWWKKVLIGGLLTLIPIIGPFYGLGYLLEAIKNVISGREVPLPEALEALRACHDASGAEEPVVLGGYDPANISTSGLGMNTVNVNGWVSFSSPSESFTVTVCRPSSSMDGVHLTISGPSRCIPGGPSTRVIVSASPEGLSRSSSSATTVY